jgi:hypothetical protein
VGEGWSLDGKESCGDVMSHSTKRPCIVSACSIILFLVMILFERVDDVFLECVM